MVGSQLTPAYNYLHLPPVAAKRDHRVDIVHTLELGDRCIVRKLPHARHIPSLFWVTLQAECDDRQIQRVYGHDKGGFHICPCGGQERGG